MESSPNSRKHNRTHTRSNGSQEANHVQEVSNVGTQEKGRSHQDTSEAPDGIHDLYVMLTSHKIVHPTSTAYQCY